MHMTRYVWVKVMSDLNQNVQKERERERREREREKAGARKRKYVNQVTSN